MLRRFIERCVQIFLKLAEHGVRLTGTRYDKSYSRVEMCSQHLALPFVVAPWRAAIFLYPRILDYFEKRPAWPGKVLNLEQRRCRRKLSRGLHNSPRRAPHCCRLYSELMPISMWIARESQARELLLKPHLNYTLRAMIITTPAVSSSIW